MSANIAETFELLFDKNNNVAYKALQELQVYIADFGKKKDDVGLVAEDDKKAVGAVWE